MNFVQIIFSLMTSIIIIFGSLMNIFENYLPCILRQSFRYGKFAYSGKNNPLVIEFPKSWFKHFYKLASVIYTFVLYLTTSVYIFNKEVPAWFNNFLNLLCGEERIAFTSASHIYLSVILITCQVYRRFYDTHYVSIFGKNSRINLTHYIVGMIYYPLVIIALLCEAPKFANISLGSSVLSFSDITYVDIGVVIVFFWAWWHQHVTTVILANLRKNDKGKIVTDDHKLPNGDWFEYLSSPHSSAEILMYLSVTVILVNNISWWFVVFWVISNQVEMILLSHWWYKEKFDDFPKNRRALIPFVY